MKPPISLCEFCAKNEFRAKKQLAEEEMRWIRGNLLSPPEPGSLFDASPSDYEKEKDAVEDHQRPLTVADISRALYRACGVPLVRLVKGGKD